MRKSLLILSVLLTTILPAAVWARSSAVGKIVFLDGSVKIVRNERPLTNLDIGSPIENFDTITTGPRSQVEISLNKETGVGGTIKLAANSSFYLELSALRKEQRGTIQLLAGNIGLKIDKMVGNSGLDVKTEGAVMGVRGTQFQVEVSPAGEFLVGTAEGKVEVTNDDGEVKESVPGSAVEILPGEQFRTIPVAVSTLDSFEKSWLAQRIEAFKANAPRAVRNFAQRYIQLSAQLKRAFERMESEGRATIDTWKDQDSKGVLSGRVDVMKEKKSLIGGLMNVRKVFFIFERIYYRLKEMRTYVEGTATMTSEIRRGLMVRDFFAQMDRDEKVLQQWMAEYKYLLKLYADRNDGSVPTEAAASDDFSTGGFFD